ncbi:hypothetical protein SCHPADRAFT_41523 [Schizopora paradoxa]|uniref:Uncharacterized protein n=1 Tax=Schizopora paradoxa TaxID=27342 RepID=A0A0H2S764_9AGAM|nr:hypothetical protein SCHPADRAFT_41523 [Schizopora paradoxa]
MKIAALHAFFPLTLLYFKPKTCGNRVWATMTQTSYPFLSGQILTRLYLFLVAARHVDNFDKRFVHQLVLDNEGDNGTDYSRLLHRGLEISVAPFMAIRALITRSIIIESTGGYTSVSVNDLVRNSRSKRTHGRIKSLRNDFTVQFTCMKLTKDR